MALPNLLTILRLLLAVPLFVLITRATPAALDAGVVLFLVIGATDVLDGLLARRSARVSRLGRVLDPLSDKVIICGALIFLIDAPGGPRFGVRAWMVVTIVIREFAATSIRALVEGLGSRYPANIGGKVKMFCESLAVAAILVAKAHFAQAEGWRRLTAILVAVAVAVTVFTGVLGIIRALPHLRRAERDVEASHLSADVKPP
jgi:CDP-diacylglycerol--glycerol-3-phosphate 3-phosphatidyltransferase